MGDVWKDLKKNKPMLIGVVFAIIAVLYIVYKSSNANKTASSTAPNQSTDPNAQSSQLGGYIMLDEIVNNPPPLTVNINGSGSKTKGGDGDHPPKRTPGGSHPPKGIHHHLPKPPPVRPPGTKPPIPVDIPPGRGRGPGGRLPHQPMPPVRPPFRQHVPVPKVIKSPVPLHTPPGHNTRVVQR